MTDNPTPGSQTELDELLALARRHRQAQQYAAAANAYHQILATKPNVAVICFELAEVLSSQGKLEEAKAYLERAVSLRPDFAQAQHALANLLRGQGKLDAAHGRFETVAALMPRSAEAHNNVANVLTALGRFDEAAQRYQQALAVKPDFAEAHNNLGNIFRIQGHVPQAMAHYDRAIALQPDYAEPYFGRSALKTFRPGDADLAALEAVAAQADHLPASKMLNIHFALAKALDDVGQYDRAFEHLSQGNAIQHRAVGYDEPNEMETFRLVRELIDSQLLERFAGAGDPSPAPIFILGMPRSGSTLVEQILASHPQVQAAGELPNLSQVAGGVMDSTGRSVPYPNYLPALQAADFRRLGHAYLAGLPRPQAGKTRITDKMPNNFLCVGLIRLILPNAHIIHTMRDPVDTCLSCFSKLFTSGQTFSYDLAELGRYWRQYNELMGHWRTVLPPGAMLEVRYEDVVGNLEEQARRLIDFCGLPWDASCLSFHKTKRPIATASDMQARQPLYRSSVERWRHYEAHLGPLLAELTGHFPSR
jgi:tetratricopeptide (TPR) repeat protein